MISKFRIIIITLLFFLPLSATAEMMVVLVQPNSLSYDLSPSNYKNSSSNYENSYANYNNSIYNYDNSPSNYYNSSSNYDNSFGINRLYNQNREIVGYAVYSPVGTLNIFSVSGRRLGYKPASSSTQSIFGSESSVWCGTLALLNGAPVVGLTESCYYRLISNQ